MPTIGNNRARKPRRVGLRNELLRAEMAGELSEFHAISFQAILAIAEGSDAADDYLEMAEAVAVADREFAVVAGIRATRDHIQGSFITGHSRASSDQVAKLWRSVVVALAPPAPQRTRIRRKK